MPAIVPEQLQVVLFELQEPLKEEVKSSPANADAENANDNAESNDKIANNLVRA
jgi:ubiquitin-protein ligase